MAMLDDWKGSDEKSLRGWPRTEHSRAGTPVDLLEVGCRPTDCKSGEYSQFDRTDKHVSWVHQSMNGSGKVTGAGGPKGVCLLQSSTRRGHEVAGTLMPPTIVLDLCQLHADRRAASRPCFLIVIFFVIVSLVMRMVFANKALASGIQLSADLSSGVLVGVDVHIGIARTDGCQQLRKFTCSNSLSTRTDNAGRCDHSLQFPGRRTRTRRSVGGRSWA